MGCTRRWSRFPLLSIFVKRDFTRMKPGIASIRFLWRSRAWWARSYDQGCHKRVGPSKYCLRVKAANPTKSQPSVFCLCTCGQYTDGFISQRTARTLEWDAARCTPYSQSIKATVGAGTAVVHNATFPVVLFMRPALVVAMGSYHVLRHAYIAMLDYIQRMLQSWARRSTHRGPYLLVQPCRGQCQLGQSLLSGMGMVV